jgi:EpsD family peptidyl-prolyl cis-trans isomerase
MLRLGDGPLRAGLLMGLACVALTACGKTKEPSGQVVATVGKHEITQRELKAELGNFSSPDAKTMRAAEQQALQTIVRRKLIVEAAEDQKLDKSADFALQKQRAVETALAQTWQKGLVKDMPPSSREEAEHYIASHPDSFAQRKIFTIDQLQTPLPISNELSARLQPLNSLEEVAALLTAAKVPFQRVATKLDAATSDPVAIENVMKLPPNSLFAVPQGNVLMINKVTSVQIEPFVGEPAMKAAMQRLQMQHTIEAVNRATSSVFTQGAAKVKYAKGYEPPAAPKPAAPAAKAAPATPPAK